MRLSRTLLSFLGALLLVSDVQADPIPFDYSMPITTVFNNNNSLHTSSVVFGIGGSGSGSVTTQINDYILTTATLANPDSLENVPISISVNLVDDGSQGKAGAITGGQLTFNGSLSIDYIAPVQSHDANDWRLSWAESQAAITLGSPGQSHTYTVTAPAVVFVPHSGDAVVMNIQATDYTPGSDPLPGQTAVTSTPEPTSLLMALLALPALTLARRYRTRRAAAALPEA